ncbi:MAG: hypothetical protein SGPRY_005162 [Prymnesium sp.]
MPAGGRRPLAHRPSVWGISSPWPDQSEKAAQKGSSAHEEKPEILDASHVLAGCLVGSTILFAYWVHEDVYEGRSAAHVWWHGWVTAVSTGLGALPIALCSHVSEWWMALANALAAGMMCAASCALLDEGRKLEWEVEAVITPLQGLVFGAMAGCGFVAVSEKVLDQMGHFDFAVFDGVDARKVSTNQTTS